jgi:phospholipid transport system substrate-binding protein
VFGVSVTSLNYRSLRILDVATNVARRLHSHLVNLIRDSKMKRLLSMRSLLFTILMVLVPAFAIAEPADAEHFVRERHGQLVSLLQQPKNVARESRVSSSIDAVFDYQRLAERSLGDEWNKLSEDERKQFRELLEKLVRQSYRKSIDSTLGYQVDFRGTRVVGGDTVVATVAKHKTDTRKATVSIDYVLVSSDGNWRAADVVVEGSSLVGNYRSQFTRIIRKSGFQELIKKMNRKLEKGEK